MITVLGPGGSGKSTFSEELARVRNERCASSSFMIAKNLWDLGFVIGYKDFSHFYANRSKHREELYEHGVRMREDGGNIPRSLHGDGFRIVDGYRDKQDLLDCVYLTKVFIWCYREDCRDDTLKFHLEDVFAVARCPVIFCNNGGTEENWKALAREMNERPVFKSL